MRNRIKRVTIVSIVAFLISSSMIFLPNAHIAPLGQDLSQGYETALSNINSTLSPNNFSYLYKMPSVPNNVGAQGITGSLVPQYDLGPLGKIGPIGHVGPVGSNNPGKFPKIPAHFSLQVYNGTLNPLSRSPSSYARVILQNNTYGTITTMKTSLDGWVNSTVFEGYYYLSINQSGNGYASWHELIDISSSNYTITRYLIPISYCTPLSVKNGPSSQLFNASIHVYFTNGIAATQMSVIIENESGGNAKIGSVITNNFGWANFTQLDNSFKYRYIIDGHEQNLTSYYFGGGNVTNSFTGTSGTETLTVFVPGHSHWTASVVGSKISPGYNSTIQVSQTETLIGGKVWISAPFTFNGNAVIRFVNTTVYVNSSLSIGSTYPIVAFNNTTVIMLGASQLNQASVISYANYSAFFYASIYGKYPMGNYISLNPNIDYHNDVLTGSLPSEPNVTSQLDGEFTNSSFISFNVTKSAGESAYGNLIANHDSIVNSTILVLQLTFSNGVFERSDIYPGVIASTFNNSYVNITNYSRPEEGSSWNFGKQEIFSQVYFSEVDSTMPDNSWQGGSRDFGGGLETWSNSILNFTPTSISWHPDIILVGQTIKIYDSLATDWPNPSLVWPLLNESYQQGWQIASQNYFINYTTLEGLNYVQFHGGQYFNATFSHDDFKNKWDMSVSNPFEVFAGVPSSGASSISFQNDTFRGIYVLPGAEAQFWASSGTSGTSPWFQPLNVPNPPQTRIWGRVSVNYSTAWTYGYGYAIPVEFLGGEGGIQSYYSHDLFWNDPRDYHMPGNLTQWRNSSYGQAPIASPIGVNSGVVVIENSWFMNLTNATLPFTVALLGSGGQGTLQKFVMGNNHFFYAPNTLQKNVPTFTSPLKDPYNTVKRYDYVVNNPTHANLSYEIPINPNVSVQLSNVFEDQYLFNSTTLQINPIPNAITNYVNPWVIEPDINTSTGLPVVSFNNGGEAGIQPNFTWNGSSYQLAVEPNMTYIKSSQPTASKIGLEFTVPAGFLNFNIWMYNTTDGKDQHVKSIPESNQSSQITVMYNPANMPQEAVFFTNQSTGYKITFIQSGLPAGTAWSVRLGGVTADSTSGSIVFYAGNGSYTYIIQNVQDYYPSPSSGRITINGQNTSVLVKWSERLYDVAFVESGLPINTRWIVTLNGFTKNSTQNLISFSEANGTYDYAISNASGYQPEAPAGLITVNGSNETVNVKFNANTYRIIFQVFDLTGQIFSIILNGTIQTSNSSRVVFNEPAGTYSYYIKGPKYFTANITSGIVKVTDHDYYVNISFNPEKIELINSYNIINFIPPLFTGFVVAISGSACFMFIYKQKIKEWLKHLMREKN